MKKFILSLFVWSFAATSFAQVSKTVNLTTAGTLASILTNDEKKNIHSLTISGLVDARDFKTMHDSIRYLDAIDLTNVQIVEHTDVRGVFYPANTIPDSAFMGNRLWLVILPNTITSIGCKAFKSDYSYFKTISIPNSVTSIGDMAFTGCTHLESFTIPPSVTFIGDSAFSRCSGLTNIIIPKSVTSIGNGVFRECLGLTSIIIPNTISSIGSYAFVSCIKLCSICALQVKPITLDENAFWSIKKDIPLYVPFGSKDAYQKADVWKEFTNIIEVNSGIYFSTDSIKLINTQTAKVIVTAANDISTASNQTWLTVTPASAGVTTEITITAETIATETNRSGFIIVSSGDNKDSIAVTQFSPYIMLSNTSLDMTDTTAQTVDVTAPNEWTTNCSADWITGTPNSATGNGTLRITAKANKTVYERTATITVHSQVNYNTYKTITIKQAAAKPNIKLSATEVVVTDTTTAIVTVNAIGSWKVICPDMTDWITYTPSYSSNDNESMKITAKPNFTGVKRSTSIQVVSSINSDTLKTITITQDAQPIPTIELSTQTIDLTSTTTAKITVSTTGSWSATSNQSWLTITPTSGNGSGEITITAEPNTTGATRTATITIAPNLKADGDSKTITVTQSAADVNIIEENGLIKVSSNTILASDITTAKIAVVMPYKWQASSNQLWAIVSPAAGEGNAEIIITLEPNTTGASRTAMVTVYPLYNQKSDQGPFTITVIQSATNANIIEEGGSIHLSTDSIFVFDDTLARIAVLTPNKWEMTCSESWIKLGSTSGIGNGVVNISIEPNTTGASRTAIITFTPSSSLKADQSSYTIYIIQSANSTAAEEQITIETRIYPNPTHSHITIGAPAAEGQVVSLIAPNGSVLAQTSVSGGTAQFSAIGLPKGIYTVQLQSKEKAVSQRVVLE